MTVPWQLGLAISSAVPMLVLVSLGPVAALVGPPSILVWAVAAVIGMVMAVPFAELTCLFHDQTGGIAVMSAHALRPRCRLLAVIVQWSYWLGWSLVLAINGILVGEYLRGLVLPGSSSWTAWVIATVILSLSVWVNHRGIRLGAWLQVFLLAISVPAFVLLIGGRLLSGGVDLGRLLPFEPPGGWEFPHVLVAFAGAFFVAGWSAYGAEVALSYRTEYRGGSRAVVRSLMATAVVTVLMYSALPTLLAIAAGPARVKEDPALLLGSLSGPSGFLGPVLVPAVITGTLLLTVNMIAIASSRTLFQMARNGDAWRFLGHLNRHAVPGNALLFDLVANAAVLAISLSINAGRSEGVSIALLATANVGYFVSIILALVATLVMRRDHPDRLRPFRSPPGFIGIGLSIAAFNLVLLGAAGAAWGWRNIGLGVIILVAAVTVLTPRRAHSWGPASDERPPSLLVAGEPSTPGDRLEPKGGRTVWPVMTTRP